MSMSISNHTASKKPRRSIAKKRAPTALIPKEQKEVTEIYQISTKELKHFFSTEETVETRKSQLEQFEGVQGVLNKLATEPNTGIIGDERDIYRRQSFFGQNEKPRPQIPPFRRSLRDALNDMTLLVLGIFAILGIITGMIYNKGNGWIEGVCILAAIFLLVLITAINDWSKDKKFVRLQSLVRDEKLPIIRGKQGSIQTLNVWDVVVGDVVNLNPGDQVPADCLVIHSNQLMVDESKAKTAEVDAKSKGVNDPFLFAGSFLVQGTCRAVVTCVGRHSSRGIVDVKLDTEQKTALQKKLYNMSKKFTRIGLVGAIVFLALSLTLLAIQTGLSEEVGAVIFSKKFVENLTIALVIVIVAIPEGLPMTVAISLAYSVILMFEKDEVLIRDLESPEKMGQVTEFCTGKTGTMTSEDMTMLKLYAQSCLVLNTNDNTLTHCQIMEQIVDLIKESVIFNSQAHIEMTENAFYEPVGNGTEVSMLKWLQKCEIPVHEIMASREGRILCHVPFSSMKKRSLIAVRHPVVEDLVRVYVKGAPEIVLNNCNYQFDVTGSTIRFDQDAHTYVTEDIVTGQMCSQGLRTLALSYKNYTCEEFENMRERLNNFEHEDDILQLEKDNIFLGVFALHDPLRPRVRQVVSYAHKGGMNVRIVSGDHLETVKALAIDAGVLPEEAVQDHVSAEVQRNYAMEAADFRNLVGGVEEIKGEDGEITFAPKNQQAFEQIIDTLKVLGRADARDKLLMVAGLAQMGKKVAVVGDGINDLAAFKVAHVSIAMGSGTSLAKNNSSMILATNDFEACMKAVMWGRNIYTNIRRFLQFQITANFSVLLVVIIGTVQLTESPFNAVQLLWINLIMDIFAALALATAPPLANVIRQKAISDDTPILSKVIWRQIYGITLWNVVVMSIIIFAGKTLFGLEYVGATQATDNTLEGLAKKQHLTIIFTTFIFLQFFNLLNCRVVGAREFNIFRRFFNNWIFVVLLVLIVLVQWSTTSFLGLLFFFETALLDNTLFWKCIVWGATVLLFSVLLKMTPEHWVEKIPVKIDEQAAPESKLVNAFEHNAHKEIVHPRNKSPHVDTENVDEEEEYEQSNEQVYEDQEAAKEYTELKDDPQDDDFKRI